MAVSLKTGKGYLRIHINNTEVTVSLLGNQCIEVWVFITRFLNVTAPIGQLIFTGPHGYARTLPGHSEPTEYRFNDDAVVFQGVVDSKPFMSIWNPPQENSKPFFCICGPRGSGKTSVQDWLSSTQGLRPVRSATTRQRRPGEPEDSYYFMSNTAFRNTPKVESAVYADNWYGTPVDEFYNSDFMVIEAQGVLSLKEFGRPVYVIYLQADEDKIIQRLQERGWDESKIQAQLEIDRKQLELLDTVIDIKIPDGTLGYVCQSVLDFIQRKS